MIIYGRNSYNAKTVKLSEVGVHDQVSGIVQFELRQQYAHVYWIPIFPIGSMWCVRKTDNKLYEVNSDFLPTLNALPRRKMGWVAFLGPIIIAFGFLFYRIFV
jgi:hypothetical protein